jgi:hypothetical protein
MDGYLGIDVSKARLDVLLMRADKREGQQFTNTPTGQSSADQGLCSQPDAAQ